MLLVWSICHYMILVAVPKKGRQLEIDEAGAINMYNISKADCEDGEIILELEMLEE